MLVLDYVAFSEDLDTKKSKQMIAECGKQCEEGQVTQAALGLLSVLCRIVRDSSGVLAGLPLNDAVLDELAREKYLVWNRTGHNRDGDETVTVVLIKH